MHVPAAGPHASIEIVRQISPSQQPLGHDAALHRQTPLSHTCPDAHAGPSPQRQVPALSHRLATIGSQATQVAPPTPQ